MQRLIRTALCFQVLLLGSLCLWAQSSSSTGQSPAPDNTMQNQQGQMGSQPTADQQPNSTTDREVTHQIRKSIMKDKSLSSDAHNVKVISQNGMVTLKGPVDSADEKKAVESKAAEVAGGADKVNSQLMVKGQ